MVSRACVLAHRKEREREKMTLLTLIRHVGVDQAT